MNLLRIDSSVRVENSKTRMLTDHFLDELTNRTNFNLKKRGVGINPPSFPTDNFIKANYTPETERTEQMNNILKKSDILIDELIKADKIVIASPMYNFSISATLKAYFDNIVRVGRTFSLDHNGNMQGLLAGKKVLVITSRGAMSYKNGEILHPFDFQENYLRALFNFLGITDITFINTEAQDFGTNELKNNNFEQSEKQLTELAKNMVTEEILNRKGARKVQHIPQNVLDLLNKGQIETVNLTEWLAVNQIRLIEHTFPNFGMDELVVSITTKIKEQKKPSTMASIKLIGQQLYEHCTKSKSINSVFGHLANHKSDTIRCYSTYLIALDQSLSISEKLDQSKKLVADGHFGVREIVWMALRPEIEKNLEESIEILSSWTKSSDENIRRFTTESTRPRGVWCKHLDNLKENPEQALPILEPLKSDKSKYVQDSVGNWLNDASKSKPEFVAGLCKKWKMESPTAETEKIIKRAKRTIEK